MAYTQKELRAASAALAEFSARAAGAGRAEDADRLLTGADVCGLCADNFGTSASEIRRAEDPADAFRARQALAMTMTPASTRSADPECCPYTHEGICSACGVFRVQFHINGSPRHFVCLTLWSQGPYGR